MSFAKCNQHDWFAPRAEISDYGLLIY